MTFRRAVVRAQHKNTGADFGVGCGATREAGLPESSTKSLVKCNLPPKSLANHPMCTVTKKKKRPPLGLLQKDVATIPPRCLHKPLFARKRGVAARPRRGTFWRFLEILLRCILSLWGNVCPARYLCFKYLISSPELIVTLGSPPSRLH